MESVELIVKFLMLGGFITLMMWLDRRFDWRIDDWACGMGGDNRDDSETRALRERIASLEAVVADRDWQLDQEFDALQRRSTGSP